MNDFSRSTGALLPPAWPGLFRPALQVAITALLTLLPARTLPTAECDGGKRGPCRYPVADRANSLRQFLEAAERDPALIKVCFAARAVVWVRV